MKPSESSFFVKKKKPLNTGKTINLQVDYKNDENEDVDSQDEVMNDEAVHFSPSDEFLVIL